MQIGKFESTEKTKETITMIDKNNDQMIELWELLQADFTPVDKLFDKTDCPDFR